MRSMLFILLAVGLVSAKTKVVTEKVLKADTVVTVKCDTTKTVIYDTITVNKTVQDTSILLKTDTTVKAAKRPEVKTKK